MIQNLDKRYTGDDYMAAKNADRVLPNMVDPLSKTNFPMCMKSCQDTLRVINMSCTLGLHF